MIKRFCKWYLQWDYSEYIRGWKAGVNQQLHEPKSAQHGYISSSMYWRGEEE